ncbi:MAG TPA: hypothetical protein VF444_14600 [Pseudonocardiaceae bacterium]
MDVPMVMLFEVTPTVSLAFPLDPVVVVHATAPAKTATIAATARRLLVTAIVTFFRV